MRSDSQFLVSLSYLSVPYIILIIFEIRLDLTYLGLGGINILSLLFIKIVVIVMNEFRKINYRIYEKCDRLIQIQEG